MPIAWYIAPYAIWDKDPLPTPNIRYCTMEDYTKQIRESGGDWAETEVLGNRAIVKVRASQKVLDQLTVVFKRLPKDNLDDSLVDLSEGTKDEIKNELTGMGYTLSEIKSKLGDDIGAKSLRDVLWFMASRRKKPRFDKDTQRILLDGVDQKCRPIEFVDEEVK